MGVLFGVNKPRSASLLEGIVADGVRALDRRFQVAALEDMKLPIGLMRPDTRQVIGLEFEPDRVAFIVRPDPRIDAEQVLNMVAILVGHDIGLRELGFRAAQLFELPEEGGIKVDLLVARTIERPDVGRGPATAGIHGATEKNELRWFEPRPP